MNDGRRLSDKILAAHEHACADGKKEIADLLLKALEIDLSAIGGDRTERREALEMLEAAFDRNRRIKRNR